MNTSKNLALTKEKKCILRGTKINYSYKKNFILPKVLSKNTFSQGKLLISSDIFKNRINKRIQGQLEISYFLKPDLLLLNSTPIKFITIVICKYPQQRCIQNLRWSFLQKRFTVKNCSKLSQIAPSQIFDWDLNMPLHRYFSSICFRKNC